MTTLANALRGADQTANGLPETDLRTGMGPEVTTVFDWIRRPKGQSRYGRD
jgi:hypothetical protein